jgi:L,D-transpeptidase YcbB
LIAGLLLVPVVTPWLRIKPAPAPVPREIRAALSPADGDIARFYGAEEYRPLWIVGRTLRPDAAALIAALSASDKDGLNPASYHVQALTSEAAGARGDPKALARTELALSRAYVAYAHDLHHPAASAGLSFVDPAVRMPRTGAFGLLEQAEHDRSPTAALRAVQRVNPIYAALRDSWNARRAAGGDDKTARLLRINMERARALPPDLGQRYILVNPAAETLWTYADGHRQERMRVVVGKLTEPTPAMIGLVRYALFNPYWNVPPDLVRDKIAPKVLGHGVAYVKDLRFQALDGYKPDAAVLDPAKIDWKAVASGAQVLRVRQRPGPHNMMGTVKFMLPNPLGIYLHDTPMRGLFGDASRTDSAGCVRLQHPARLATWIFGQKQAFDSKGAPDQRVELPRPVPVYILYLTAQPGPDGISYPPDIYSRDPGVKTALGLSGR